MSGGRFHIPDAPEMKRETLVTSVIAAAPLQVQRIAGPTWITLYAAGFTGGAFIFPTFHWYVAGIVSAGLAVACVLIWLWRLAPSTVSASWTSPSA